MAIQVLSDINHNGNKISNPTLEAAKFGASPTTPEAGHFYNKNGVLYYRNSSNAETPVHENALRTITGATGSPITATITETTAEIAIAPATATTPGTLSAEQFGALSNATHLAIPGTFVKRFDETASAEFAGVYADFIEAASISGLAAPVGDSSATSKLYVDAQIQEVLTAALRSQDFKAQSVILAVDTNLPDPLSTTYSGTEQDGVILGVAPGESILLINQTNAAENGAYTATPSGLVRRADSNSATNLTPGATYAVETGTYAQHFFTLAAPRGFVLGTDPLTFVDVAGVNTVIAGDGLVKAGQTINVVGRNGQITVNADEIAIASTYAGQSSITTVGVISNPEAVWNGNAIAVDAGGTGAATATAALTNLGAQHEVAFVCGDGSATEFALDHNLFTYQPSVTGFYNGQPLGAVDFNVVNGNQILAKASIGGNPIANQSLVIIVKARYGGAEFTTNLGGGAS